MLNIFAPINLLGYGIHANNLIKALSDKNIDLNLTKIGQVQVDPYFEPYYKATEARLPEFNAKNPSLFIFHDEFSNQSSGSPLAIFSVFETSKLKPLSKAMLNNGPADIIFTTTQQHANLLKENGITKPIHVVPEGIDDCIYNTIPATKYIDTKKFTFITVGKHEKRKCTNETVQAFMKVADGKPVALIAHTFNPFLNNQKDHPFKNLACWIGFDPAIYGFKYMGWSGKAHKFTKKETDVYFTAPTIQTAEMACLYHSANVGLQLSRGEGWDLPLTEMMACGLPTIATVCLGHSEYLMPSTDRSVPEAVSELLIMANGNEVANDEIWFKGEQGTWNTYDTNNIESKIQLVMDNQEKYTPKSEEIATYMETNFAWAKAADKITTILNLEAV